MPIGIQAVRADVKADVKDGEDPDKDAKRPDIRAGTRETAEGHLWISIGAKPLEEHGKEDDGLGPRRRTHKYLPRISFLVIFFQTPYDLLFLVSGRQATACIYLSQLVIIHRLVVALVLRDGGQRADNSSSTWSSKHCFFCLWERA